jgi:hypothetical protein
VVAVPTGAITGGVVVTTATGVASTPFNFKVLPHITSMTLSQGPPQVGFLIVGTNFGTFGAQSKVEFVEAGGNRTPLTILAGGWIDVNIKVQIPVGVGPAPGATKPGTLVVTNADGASNTPNFTITQFDCSLIGLK